MPTLIIHTGAIGDFLLCCPTLAALAHADSLEVAGAPERHTLAVAAGLVHKSHGLDSTESHTVFAGPSKTLRDFISRFNRVIAWMRDEDGTLRRALESCGPDRVDVFPGLPGIEWIRHASEYYSECLGLGPLPPLRLAIKAAGPSLDVVIHPGSGSFGKNWPLDRFLEVARKMTERGRRVTWVAGPAECERAIVSELVAARSGDEILQGLDLLSLARRLATARTYLGNDSGISHLAAALGVQSCVVFGPTDPGVWAPRGPNVSVVRGTPWPTIADVAAAAGVSE